jgi:ferredoxin, 2Fe-2S
MSMLGAVMCHAQAGSSPSSELKVHVRTRSGESVVVTSSGDEFLMQPMRDQNVDIEATCGGCASCGTCHVYVQKEWLDRLPPISDEEAELISGLSCGKENSRLACQLKLDASLDGIQVTVAPSEG